MANYCKYSIRVKGKELACNAFWAMIPVLDWSEITDIETEDGLTVMTGEGYCKWALDAYISYHDNLRKLTDQELQDIVDGKDTTNYWEYPVEEKSLLCDVQVWACSADIENYTGIYEECYFSGVQQYFGYDDIYEELSYTIKKEAMEEASRVKFTDGKSYLYAGIYEPGTIVEVEGSKKGMLGMVTGNEFTTMYNLNSISKKLGQIEPAHFLDLKSIWYSLSVEERKQLISQLGKKTNSIDAFDSGATALWIQKGYEEKMGWKKYLIYLGGLSGRDNFELPEEVINNILERKTEEEERKKKEEEQRRLDFRKKFEEQNCYGYEKAVDINVIIDPVRDYIVLKNSTNLTTMSNLLHVKKKVYFAEKKQSQSEVYIFDKNGSPHVIGTVNLAEDENRYGKICFIHSKKDNLEIGIELEEFEEGESKEPLAIINNLLEKQKQEIKKREQKEREEREQESFARWQERNAEKQEERQKKRVEKEAEKQIKKNAADEAKAKEREIYHNRVVEKIEIKDEKVAQKLDRLFERLEMYYPEHAVFALDAINSKIREDASALAKTIGYKNYDDMFKAYGWKILQGDEVKEIRNIVIYTPGNEPDFLKTRVDNTVENLGVYYPNHVIEGSIQEKHKKIASTISGLYQWFGYETIADFLKAYGFEYKLKSISGRPTTFNAEEILEIIKERMNGVPYSSMTELFQKNDDIKGKIKTLNNRAADILGMPLVKYLKVNCIIKKGGE